MKPDSRNDPPTVDRIRIDIDEGRTGEKVAFEDPAAAPLGTDAEAGGNPPTRAERRLEDSARKAAETEVTRWRPATGAMLLIGAGAATALLLAIVLLQSFR